MRNFRWCQRRHYICTLPWIALPAIIVHNAFTITKHYTATLFVSLIHLQLSLSDANTNASLSNCMQLHLQNALILYIMVYNWVMLYNEAFHYEFVQSATSSIKIISSLDVVLLALVCATLFCYHYRNLNEMPPSQSNQNNSKPMINIHPTIFVIGPSPQSKRCRSSSACRTVIRHRRCLFLSIKTCSVLWPFLLLCDGPV